MEEIIKIGLPIYYTLYVGLAFFAKIYFSRKVIKKEVFIIEQDDNVNRLMIQYFGVFIFVMILYLFTYSTPLISDRILISFDQLSVTILQAIGCAVMILSLILILVAQNQMKDSWRIGIDKDKKTALVTNGLFQWSRNPIYLGVLLIQFGLFILTPNVWTLMLFIVPFMLIQIHVRLEEDFLFKEHGAKFTAYKSSVRRFI